MESEETEHNYSATQRQLPNFSQVLVSTYISCKETRGTFTGLGEDSHRAATKSVALVEIQSWY